VFGGDGVPFAPTTAPIPARPEVGHVQSYPEGYAVLDDSLDGLHGLVLLLSTQS